MQIWAALGSGFGQDEPASQARAKQRQLLRDVATEREAEDVDFLQAERVDEGERVASHVVHVVGNDSGRAGDAAVVEQDHFAILGEPVDEHWVPAVEVAAEMLQADQRRRVRLLVAEAAIAERVSADLDRPVCGVSWLPVACARVTRLRSSVVVMHPSSL